MNRTVEVIWGSVLLLFAFCALGMFVWSHTLAENPPQRAWWSQLLLVAIWIYVIVIGIRRIRGRSRAR